MKPSRRSCKILKVPARKYSLVDYSFVDSKPKTSRAAEVSNSFFDFAQQASSVVITENSAVWKRDTAMDISGSKSNLLLGGSCTHRKLIASLDESDITCQSCIIPDRYSWLNNNNLNLQRASQLCQEINLGNSSPTKVQKSCCLTHWDLEKGRQQPVIMDMRLRNAGNKLSTPRVIKPIHNNVQLFKSSETPFIQAKKSHSESLHVSHCEMQKIFQVDRFQKRVGLDIFLDSASNKKLAVSSPQENASISQPEKVRVIEVKSEH